MNAPKVITLGCRLNAFESEIIRDHALRAGVTDTVYINTCTVTAEAERQARQTIRRQRRDQPDARIVVTGCAAQLAPEKFIAMDEVDQVLGNEEKLEPSRYLKTADEADVAVTDIMTVKETASHLISGFDGRARAFVQIQQGCDHRCTFCIIPFARGNNRSLERDTIVKQTRKLVGAGFAEIVLTGVDICSYGGDLPIQSTLGELVQKLLQAVPELKRLRLTSLDPAAMDDKLYDAIAGEPRVMPHIHLSLQSMDAMILKRMKRRHSPDDAVRVVERIREIRPGVVFGADLIAGFPTETDSMFANTLQAVNDLGLTHLHVFPYSERSGTPAAEMPGVDKAVRKQRAQTLRAAGDKAMAAYMQGMVGKDARVLVERPDKGMTEHYVDVALDGNGVAGDILEIRITGVVDGQFTGQHLTDQNFTG